MNAPIPKKTLHSLRFNQCVDDLFRRFASNGMMTRQTFRTTCRQWNQQMSHVQIYFESVGLQVLQRGRNKSANDRFCWRPKA